MRTLRALLVTPLSGPLAQYGRAGAAALRLWAEEAADLPPPWQEVRLDIEDVYPDAGTAIERGLTREPHLLFGPYGSGPTLEALRATERVLWNHGGAASRIQWPTFPRAVNVLAPASTYFHGTLEAVRSVDPEALRVVILHTVTGFGADVAAGADELARRLGFRVEMIGFPVGEAGRFAAASPAGDVVLVAGGFADEQAAARVLLGRVRGALAFVGAGVEEVLAPLGDAREGLLGPAQWLPAMAPEPDEGPGVSWFVDRYRTTAGTEPPYPAAQAFAAALLAARCLRDGATDDPSQLAAARNLGCRTLYGDFRLDGSTGVQVGHRVVTVQWQGGRRQVVWPPSLARQPLVYPRSTG